MTRKALPLALLFVMIVISGMSFAAHLTIVAKGKKQAPVSCFVTVDHFDGTLLFLRGPRIASPSEACKASTISSKEWQIAMDDNESLFNGNGAWGAPGPKPIDPGHIATSMGDKTKDVELQQADYQMDKKEAAKDAPDTTVVDLSACHSRGRDRFEIEIAGNRTSYIGTIVSMGDGLLFFQKDKDSPKQHFTMLNVRKVEIGLCQ